MASLELRHKERTGLLWRRSKSGWSKVARGHPRRDPSRAFQARYDETAEAHPLEEVPITTTRTHDVYVGVPLCDASNSGVIVQGIVQKIMEERYGVKATVPTGETNCNGRKLGPNMTTHEFFMLDKRNEVKQAQLAWAGNYWRAMWCNVKHALHDVLHLVLYTPSGLYVFEHDGKFGVSTQGKHKTPVEA